MSQGGKFFDGSTLPDLETLTGDVGGAVGSDALLNINIIGGAGVNVVGTPGTNTLTINSTGAGFIDTITGNTGGGVSGDAADDLGFTADNTQGITIVGTPATNSLEVIGIDASETQIGVIEIATNVEAVAVGETNKALVPSNMPSLFASPPIIGSTLAAAGTFSALTDTSRTQNAIAVYGVGGIFSEVGPLTNGQLLIGNTGNPATASSITSSDSTLTITAGAGTIDLTANEAVVAPAIIRDDAVVRGDGGARGIQQSTIDLNNAGHFLGTAGIIGLGGTGGVNNELLILDFETTAGKLELTSPSDVLTFEFNLSDPNILLHNNTHEDSDGGRRCRLTFQGEQSGGEKSTLGNFIFSHDGTSDDEKAQFLLKVNRGGEGFAPSTALTVDSSYDFNLAQFIKIEGDNLDTTDQSSRIFFRENSASATTGASLIYSGLANPTLGGTNFTLAAETLYLLMHNASATGSVRMAFPRATNQILVNTQTTVSNAHVYINTAVALGLEINRTSTGPCQLKIENNEGSAGIIADENSLILFDFTNSKTRLKIDNANDGIFLYNEDTFSEVKKSVVVVDDGTIVLPTSVTGELMVMVEGEPEYALCHIRDDGTVTLLQNMGSVVNTDTDTNLCIFDSGAGATIRNRLGAQHTIIYRHQYK